MQTATNNHQLLLDAILEKEFHNSRLVRLACLSALLAVVEPAVAQTKLRLST